MADSGENLVEAERRRLSYPWTEGPAHGDEAIEIAPGVKWLRMPLMGSLGFINVWALEDREGWALVDTGMAQPETADAWRRALKGPLAGRAITRVLVTHMHPDHIGMAGWLTRKFDCRLWISRLEFLTCRSLASDTGRAAPQDGVRFYRSAGWSDEQLDHYTSRFGGFGKLLHPLPDSYHRLSDGDEVQIGAHSWRVVMGCGHSPEHACLYSPDLKLLISGDQVLPKISSNVSLFPTEPDADPLGDWLTSLAYVRDQVPDDVLVLPAHNEPFHGLHTRINDLIGGHERRLEQIRRLTAEPKRVVDMFSALFRRTIDDTNIVPATGETLAHLSNLIVRGEVVKTRDSDGVDWYRSAA